MVKPPARRKRKASWDIKTRWRDKARGGGSAHALRLLRRRRIRQQAIRHFQHRGITARAAGGDAIASVDDQRRRRPEAQALDLIRQALQAFTEIQSDLFQLRERELVCCPIREPIRQYCPQRLCRR